MTSTQQQSLDEERLFSYDSIFSLPTQHRPAPPQLEPLEFEPPVTQPEPPSALVAATDEQLLAWALQNPNPTMKDLELAAGCAISQSSSVAPEQLAVILDGFARVLRGEVVEDRSLEVANLRALLSQAQETIIALLNDRVHDRARMAQLEAENRLLPDLQAQAHRAMSVATKTDSVYAELQQVHDEVTRLRAAYVRAEDLKLQQRQSENWLTKLFRF